MGFEPTPPYGDQNPQFREASLESGALDHSAILTPCEKSEIFYWNRHKEQRLCDVYSREGFTSGSPGNGPRIKGHLWTEKEDRSYFGREGKKEHHLAQVAWWVFQPLIFTEILSVVSLALGFLSFEDSEEHHQKCSKRHRFYGMNHFIFSIRFLFVPRSALPLEKCLFWAPKVTAEEQPEKILVGRDSSRRCRLDKASFCPKGLTCPRSRETLGATRLLPDLPGHSQIFRSESLHGVHCQVVDKMAIFKGDSGGEMRDVPHLLTQTFPAVSALCKVIWALSLEGHIF